MADVDPALLNRFSQHSGDPKHREQVIVTLGDNGNVADLVTNGMEVSFSAAGGTIVAGNLTASALEKVAALDSVKRVEPEGKMHALGG